MKVQNILKHIVLFCLWVCSTLRSIRRMGSQMSRVVRVCIRLSGDEGERSVPLAIRCASGRSRDHQSV